MLTLDHQQQGKTTLLDSAENVKCDVPMLAQFAVMSSMVSEQIIEVNHRRISRLNIGEKNESSQ